MRAVVMFRSRATSAVICEGDEQRAGIAHIDCVLEFTESRVHARSGDSVFWRHPAEVVARAIGVEPMQHDEAAALRGKLIARRIEHVASVAAVIPKLANAERAGDFRRDAAHEERDLRHEEGTWERVSREFFRKR